jgi:hypothetical protein
LLLDEALADSRSELQQQAAASTVAETAAAPSTAAAAAVCSRFMAAWQHWQGHGREAFFYQANLAADLAVHALTLAHHMHVWVLHGLSCQLFDALLLLDARNVLLSLLRKLRLHKAHVAATSSLDAAFPDVQTGQAAASSMSDSADTDSEAAECVICRERMASAKQLPCGHLFHLQCLRAWLQQSTSSSSSSGCFSCPMCRQPLLLPASAAAAAASQIHGRQRQLLQRASGYSGFAAAAAASGASGLASGPAVRPSLMASLSFGLLSAEELQPSAAAAAAAAAVQHEARLVQLQDRADSWDRDDALMLPQLDSPGTEASFDDVALQEALVASLQDNAAWSHSNNNSSSSRGSPGSAGDRPRGLGVSPGSYRSSSSRSPDDKCMGVSAAGCDSSLGAQSSLVLPPPAFPAGTAAAVARVLPSGGSYSRCLQQQCYVDRSSSRSSAASPNPSCSGSVSPYGGATSSSSPCSQQQQQQQCETVEAFYAQRFADPLAGAWHSVHALLEVV